LLTAQLKFTHLSTVSCHWQIGGENYKKASPSNDAYSPTKANIQQQFCLFPKL